MSFWLNLTTCPICEDKFKDPRVLPCGNTACQNCIANLAKPGKEVGEFMCPVCHQSHSVPANEFIPNLIMKQLVGQESELKQQIIRQNLMIDSAKIEVNLRLELLINECSILEANLRSGSDEIKRYCDQLKQKISLQSYSQIDRIKQCEQDLISHVDSYEEQCIEAYEKNKDAMEEKCGKQIKSLIEEIKSFYDKVKEETQELDTLLESAIEYLIKIDIEQARLNKFKFNCDLLEFQKNEEEFAQSTIGSLIHKQIDLDISTFKTIDLNQHGLKKYSKPDSYYISQVDDLVRLFYVNGASGSLRTKRFDLQGNLIEGEDKRLFSQHRIKHFQLVELHDGKMLISLTKEPGNTPLHLGHQEFGAGKTHLLFLIDSNMSYVKHIDAHVMHLAASKKSIFLLDHINYEQRDCCDGVYDFNLMKVGAKSVPLSVRSEKQFIKRIEAMPVEENELLFCLYGEIFDDLTVKIFEIERNGNLLQEIKLNTLNSNLDISLFKVFSLQDKSEYREDFMLFGSSRNMTVYSNLSSIKFTLLEKVDELRSGRDLLISHDKKRLYKFLQPREAFLF